MLLLKAALQTCETVLWPCQALDSVRQQLHSLSERHTSLVQQQITAESSALEVARLRSEVASGRTEAGLLADKVVAAQETCRQAASCTAHVQTVVIGTRAVSMTSYANFQSVSVC